MVGMDSMQITDMASTLLLVVRVSILQVVEARVSTLLVVEARDNILLVVVVSTQVDSHHTAQVISSTLEAKQVEGGMDSLVEEVVEDILDSHLQ